MSTDIQTVTETGLTQEFIQENTMDMEWDSELTPQEKLFISFYVSDAHWDEVKAYNMAKLPEAKTRAATKARALRILKKEKVQIAIDNFVNSVVDINKQRARITIMDLQTKRAFFDPAELINADGSLKYQTLEEIPAELRAIIDGIETKWYGKNADVKTTTVKLADRNRAIADLKKMFRLDEETQEEKANNAVIPVVNISVQGNPKVSLLPED